MDTNAHEHLALYRVHSCLFAVQLLSPRALRSALNHEGTRMHTNSCLYFASIRVYSRFNYCIPALYDRILTTKGQECKRTPTFISLPFVAIICSIFYSQALRARLIHVTTPMNKNDSH